MSNKIIFSWNVKQSMIPELLETTLWLVMFV